MLEEAVESRSDGVRFGSEFCEWNIPDQKTLERAYELAKSKEKDFTYVTPRVSDTGLEILQSHFAFLDRLGTVRAVVNDFGVLNIMKRYPNLEAHLGRQMIYIPARCPWDQVTQTKVGFVARRKVERIFFQTSLNYGPTVEFYKSRGVRSADVDWIPDCFPSLEFLVKNGLRLSVYTHLVPATVTRKCHTARFLGEAAPEACTRPCLGKAFLLRNDALGRELFLQGNTVFRFIPPTREGAIRLYKSGVDEFVFPMSPASGIENRNEIDQLIQTLRV